MKPFFPYSSQVEEPPLLQAVYTFSLVFITHCFRLLLLACHSSLTREGTPESWIHVWLFHGAPVSRTGLQTDSVCNKIKAWIRKQWGAQLTAFFLVLFCEFLFHPPGKIFLTSRVLLSVLWPRTLLCLCNNTRDKEKGGREREMHHWNTQGPQCSSDSIPCDRTCTRQGRLSQGLCRRAVQQCRSNKVNLLFSIRKTF